VELTQHPPFPNLFLKEEKSSRHKLLPRRYQGAQHAHHQPTRCQRLDSVADSYLDIRFYGPDTAIVTSRGDTYTGRRPEPGELSKTQTYTFVRQNDGTWRIVAFHNTKRQSAMERISFLFAPQTKPQAEK